MLGDSKAYAVLAVKDLTKAKDFYEKTLGLKAADGDDPGGIMYQCGGNTSVFVYESSFAGSNKATAASWEVGDIKAAVDELKSKGVSFEHYDMPGVKRDGDLHVIGELKAAWFVDPDGNILNLTGK